MKAWVTVFNSTTSWNQQNWTQLCGMTWTFSHCFKQVAFVWPWEDCPRDFKSTSRASELWPFMATARWKWSDAWNMELPMCVGLMAWHPPIHRFCMERKPPPKKNWISSEKGSCFHGRNLIWGILLWSLRVDLQNGATPLESSCPWHPHLWCSQFGWSQNLGILK